MKQQDSSPDKSGSEQASLGQTILKKLSTVENLLKRKDDKPLTFKEACSYLGYAPSYLYKLTYRKVIPHYKPTGKIIFFSKNELDEWVFGSSAQRRVKSDELENEKIGGSTVRQGTLQAPLTAKDPNQIEMELERKTGNTSASLSAGVKREPEETEILIEFPLKSRREKK